MQGRNSIHSPLLVRTLLQHFINQTKVPLGMLSGDGQGGSIVLGLACKYSMSINLFTVKELAR